MDIQKLNMQKQQLAQAGWKETGDGKMINPNTREVWDPSSAGKVLGDLSHLGYNADGTPIANGMAWAKNNNPAGLSWNANFDNPKPGSLAYDLLQKGIQYTKGTAR
jgi:hypothetical protein